MRNFLIVAPPGSGTTWLANFLNYSPDVLVYHEGINGCRSLDEYKEKMSKPGYRVIGDVTTAVFLRDRLAGCLLPILWETGTFMEKGLWREGDARTGWAIAFGPYLPFPEDRYEILRNFRVTDPIENMDYEAAKQLLNSLNLGVDNSQE